MRTFMYMPNMSASSKLTSLGAPACIAEQQHNISAQTTRLLGSTRTCCHFCIDLCIFTRLKRYNDVKESLESRSFLK